MKREESGELRFPSDDGVPEVFRGMKAEEVSPERLLRVPAHPREGDIGRYPGLRLDPYDRMTIGERVEELRDSGQEFRLGVSFHGGCYGILLEAPNVRMRVEIFGSEERRSQAEQMVAAQAQRYGREVWETTFLSA